MKDKLAILVLLFLTGCTPIYTLQHKEKVRSNDNELAELTALIRNNQYKLFLDRTAFNSKVSDKSVDTLGFGYLMYNDERCANDEICFSTHVLKYNDSIVSISTTPSFGRIKPAIEWHYQKVLKKIGWLSTGTYCRFENKICNFQFSALPIADNAFTYRPKYNLTMDSLMSPHTTVALSRMKNRLTENDLLYLLHSTNRWTRVQVIRHIKCNNIQVTHQTAEWMNYIIRKSPRLPAKYSQCLIGTEPINYFLDCNFRLRAFGGLLKRDDTNDGAN